MTITIPTTAMPHDEVAAMNRSPAMIRVAPSVAGYTALHGRLLSLPNYQDFFNQRFARRLANRYRKRGLDKTAQTMVEFLRQLGIEGASVLEIGGGVGEIQIELLQAGAARAQNLELSPAYQQQAQRLAGQAGVQGRLDWRVHDLAADPRGGGAGRPGGPAPGGVLLPRL
jgi:hypothetical protein